MVYSFVRVFVAFWTRIQPLLYYHGRLIRPGRPLNRLVRFHHRFLWRHPHTDGIFGAGSEVKCMGYWLRRDVGRGSWIVLQTAVVLICSRYLWKLVGTVAVYER